MRYTTLGKTPGDGYDRIQWFDRKLNTHTIRANDPVTALSVSPGERTRKPGKFKGQRPYQGHYWCAGARTSVFHESMAEYAGMMLIDHLYDVVEVYAQPMLMTFFDGRRAFRLRQEGLVALQREEPPLPMFRAGATSATSAPAASSMNRTACAPPGPTWHSSSTRP